MSLNAERMIEVSAIHIYPVKSCAGIALSAATLLPDGLEHDRHWMITDESDRFLSQRELARLALVSTEVTSDALVLGFGGESFAVPRAARELGPRPPRTVTVWSDTFAAVGYAPEVGVDAWLSRMLGQPVRLAEDSGARRLNPERAVPGFYDRVTFADGYPLLALSEESVTDLNARIRARARKRAHVDLPMNRFRPNLVFRGGGAYFEDAHERYRVGGLPMLGGRPCARCVITTIDQATLATAKEPLATLARYRRVDSEVMFGMNLRVGELPGGRATVRVGDVVTPI